MTSGEKGSVNNRSSRGNEAEILLVEDNLGDVRLIEEAFKRDKINNTLHVATDGKEALDFLFQRGEFTDSPQPDILLLDLDLPEVNGDEILTEIQNAPELKHIPVVILTGSEAQEDVVRSYDLNANAYLTKPVETDEFLELIRKFDRFWLSVVHLPETKPD